MGKGYKGRGGGKRVFKRDFKEPRDDTWQESKRRKTDYTSREDMQNTLFEDYYKQQAICPSEQWDEFVRVMKIPLPTTFRINGSGSFAEDLRKKLESDFLAEFAAGPIVVAGEEVAAPKPLPWYPGKLAWQFNFSRQQLRKQETLEKLHEFIKRQNEAGGISRQEAVSMVPPLFLDVKPHHWVLDMCAAPGSKTFQLLEMIHEGVLEGAPAGLVVANDADAQRCNLLTHQTKRICSPCLIITNHEAQHFPCVAPIGAPKSGSVQYDRILCDVPCSGDGTIRKAPDIWRRWSPANGNGLHSLQLRIATHACRLLKVGGRLVYSTCSFNPIENEAVVAELLRQAKGSMKLLDVSESMPGLKSHPGLKTWKVRDANSWYASWDAAKEAGYNVDPTMFPDAASDQLPLQYCMRLLPHHQDTGGFFLAVLEKVGDCSHMEFPSMKHRNHQKEFRRSQRKTARGAAEGEEAAPAAPPAPVEEVLAAAKDAAAASERAADDAANGDAAAASEAAAAATAAANRAAALVEGAAGAEEAAGAADAADAAEAVPKAEVPDTADAAEAALQAAVEALEAGEGAATAGEEGAAAAAEPQAGACSNGDAAVTKAGLLAVEELLDKMEWGIRGGGGRGRQQGGKWKGVDPIIPIQDMEILDSVVEFYGIDPNFQLRGQLITRSLEGAKPKRLYLVSRAVKHLLLCDDREQLKVTATGLKMFERQEVKDGSERCSYRVAQEGLPFILPFVSRRRVALTLEEFLAILQERSIGAPRAPLPTAVPAAAAAAAADASTAPAPPAVSDMPPTPTAAGNAASSTDPEPLPTPAAASAAEAAPPPSADTKGPETAAACEKPVRFWLKDPRSRTQLEAVSMGCCIATLRDEDAAALHLPATSHGTGALTAGMPLAISCWRGKATLNVQVGKVECAQMLDKIRAAQDRVKATTATATTAS